MIPTQRLRAMVHRQIRRFGDGLEITLRERSTLRTSTTGTPTNALTLAQAALAGDSEVVAESTNLAGALPAGAVVTVGAVTYTLTAAAQADREAGTLTLDLTPVLTANLSAGASLTISQPYADTTYLAMRSRLDAREAADGVPDTARTYRLSARTSSGGSQTRRPKKGDVLIDTAGTATETVTAVASAEPGDAAIYWTVTVGSAK